MKIITCNAIRKHNPCYDPATKLPVGYFGTVVDFLQQEQISAADRLWVARFFVTDKTNRLFAVWCARQALALVSNPDPRSVVACDVAERFANGAATKEELKAVAGAVLRSQVRVTQAVAADTAEESAESAAEAADAAAAWAAAESVWAATGMTTTSAARAAKAAAWAESAAWAARAVDAAWAESAAWAARAVEWAAAESAWAAAESAARAAARAAQINYLITLIEREEA